MAAVGATRAAADFLFGSGTDRRLVRMTDDLITRLIAGLNTITPPDGWVARAADRYERTTTMHATASDNDKAQDILSRSRIAAGLAIDYGDDPHRHRSRA